MLTSSSTLPLHVSLKCNENLTGHKKGDNERFRSEQRLNEQVDSPAPKSLTMSSNGAEALDTNPLRILRNKDYPIIRPRLKVNVPESANNKMNENLSSLTQSGEPCESPTYLTNPQYSFSDKDINIEQKDIEKFISDKGIENLNPLPLPPRDRNKIQLTNVKRHVRKYPLIIPVSNLQRTLCKVSSHENKSLDATDGDEIDGSSEVTLPSPSYKHNYNMPRTVTKPAEVKKMQSLLSDHSYINKESLVRDENKNVTKEPTVTAANDFNYRLYENVDNLQMQLDNPDMASLHFESILENDVNLMGNASAAVPAAAPNQRVSLKEQKDNYDIPKSSPDLENNNSIKMSDADESEKHSTFGQQTTKNDGFYFPRYRKSLSLTHTHPPIDFTELEEVNEEDEKILERKLKDSNSVSCEDLLEFADKKPKGKERGIESDEVRIMIKVLGTVVSHFIFLSYFYYKWLYITLV